jgi:23S rRNA (guanosine2251-2'-O)-methyltransferase
LETIKQSPQRVNKLLIQRDSKKAKIAEIVEIASSKQIPFSLVPRKNLEKLDKNHQGVVAFLAPKPYASFESIVSSARHPLFVLLDGIEDPQNLGAIIRSAAGAGADGVIIPERRSAGLSNTVSVVSTGALEYISVARVKNLARTMDDLKSRGIWLVGAEGEAQENWYEFDYTLPVGLVFGSEDKGLRPLIQRKCDKVLSLPLSGSVNSLNVASAASVFLYEVVRQRMGMRNE